MQLLYDQDLIESAVFIFSAMGRPLVTPSELARFHRAREKAYAILEPEERNAFFFRIHLEWFRQWGLEAIVADTLERFPLLRTELASLAFRKARNRAEEEAELYVSSETGRHGIVPLLPESLSNGNRLRPLLNHELMHVSDMLDPKFGYQPEFHQPGQTVSQFRLIRARYRLLWDITIDGRLTAGHRPTLATEEQRRREFERAFSFLLDSKRAELFCSLWSGKRLRHAELMALAADPRALDEGNQRIPGAPCPLCGFATFQWAETEGVPRQTAARIQREFSHWTLDQGACQRCIEVYQSAQGLELPSPVCL